MPDEVVQTPFGRFLVTRGELIGETTRAGTLWDGPGFLQVIAREHGRLGEKGVTILDVGANQGAFSVWLASQGAWRVVAVEPEPTVMQRLKANLDLNREVTASVVLPIMLAAYRDSNGRLGLPRLDPGNWGGTALWLEGPVPGKPDTYSVAHRHVPRVALDDFSYLWERGLSLVKIDTQGCDGAVLVGLDKTLKQHRPVIVFEWEADLAKPHGISLETVLQALTMDYGYTVHPWPTHPNNYLALPKEKA